MRFLLKLILHVVANAVALYLAVCLIDGFSVSGGAATYLVLGGILMVLNAVVRPIVKLLTGPLIILTLGLFAIIVNALMLALLDFASDALTIQGYIPLILGTVLVGLVNFLFHAGGKLFGSDSK
jgi:putative membrane protein